MNYITTCETCQKEFSVRKSELARGNGRFCSISCSSKRKGRGRTRVDVECSYCSKFVSKRPSDLKKSKSGHIFCNRKCKEAAQKEGKIKSILPAHYGTKTKVYPEDYAHGRKNCCENCGYRKYPQILHVHHLDKNRWNNSSENLVCLCPNCHDEWHLKDKSGRFTVSI